MRSSPSATGSTWWPRPAPPRSSIWAARAATRRAWRRPTSTAWPWWCAGFAISSTSPPLERVFTLRELTRLLRLSPKRRSQLRRLGLLRDDPGGIRFRELVSVRAAANLLESGASVRQVRAALDGARRIAPGVRTPLAELRLVVRDRRVVVEQDRLRLDPGTGQALLDFDARDLPRETRRAPPDGKVG